MSRERIIEDLRIFAEEIRIETFKMFANLGFGHVGGSMSIVETVAVLYGSAMNYEPKNPNWPDRDWFVMSKGHAGPAVYATLALKGFFPKEMLLELNQGGGRLPSHCDRNLTPGVDMTTGSLGQGISTAIGIALGNRMSGKDSHTYLVVGDGECNEGQIWEGAMFAAHHKLDRLIGFVDWNKQQLDGYTENVMDMGDMAEKWRAFGWNTVEVKGHDIGAVYDAVNAAKRHKGGPSMIVLDTIKGHGCSLTEGVENNHHIAFAAPELDCSIARAEEKLRGLKSARKGGGVNV